MHTALSNDLPQPQPQQQQGRRGAFIVFEGLDRCGKTTQVQRLIDGWARTSAGADVGGVKGQRFPGESIRGENMEQASGLVG
jgi:thymidylate kinase